MFTAFNGGDTSLVPPPTVDLEGTEYRQGLLHGTIISRLDLDLPVLKAKQLKLRLKSNKDECQLLYCEVHVLREQVMNVEEKHKHKPMYMDIIHNKQLKCSNKRMARYVSETQTIREELSKSEYRCCDLENKKTRLKKRSRKRRRPTQTSRNARNVRNASNNKEANDLNKHPTTIHDNNVVDCIDYLKLENALIKAEEKEDCTQKTYNTLWKKEINMSQY